MDVQFAQHIGIAEHELAQYAPAAAAFERAVASCRRFSQPGRTEEERDQQTAFEDTALRRQHAAQTHWIELWSHLDQARAVAHGRGRDVSVFDKARATAREYGSGAVYDAGEWRPDPDTPPLYMRDVKYVLGPPELPRIAIDALRLAMPEVDIPSPAASAELPQLRRSSKLLWIIAGLGLAIAIALVAFVLRGR